jgi:hypothetical protein
MSDDVYDVHTKTVKDFNPDYELPYNRLRPANIFELSLLCHPGERHEVSELGSGTAPGYLSLQHMIETPGWCRAEDQRRVQRLEALEAYDWTHLYRYGLLLAEWLEGGITSEVYEPHRASAISMRELRLRFLGSILDLLAQHGELSCKWITARHPAWRFGLKDRYEWVDVGVSVPRRFRSLLRLAGVMDAPGVLIAYMHTLFDLRTSDYHLEFRGIASGEKLNAFRQMSQILADKTKEPLLLDYVGASSAWAGRIKTASYDIRDLRREITKIMPNSITTRGQLKSCVSPGAAASARSIPEPYGSVHLLWLGQHVFEEVGVLSGVYIENGQFVLGAN